MKTLHFRPLLILLVRSLNSFTSSQIVNSWRAPGGNTRKMDPTWQFSKDFPELVITEENASYRTNVNDSEFDISLSFIPYSKINFREVANEQLPNKFFYAVPAGLISKNEVPYYAGLLNINDLSVTKIKDENSFTGILWAIPNFSTGFIQHPKEKKSKNSEQNKFKINHY